MIEYLNANSGALTVIFTGVVTISTVVYALLTAQLVNETRRMRQAQTEPKLEITLKSSDNWISLLRLHIKNIGLGPAYNIAFRVYGEADTEGANAIIKDVTKANLFDYGLRYIGPGREIITGYTQMTKMYEQKIEAVICFEVTYKDCYQKEFQEKFRIDLSEFKGLTQIGTPPLYGIMESVEKMQKSIDNIATGWKKVQVDVYSQEDRDRERRKWEKEEQEDAQRSARPA
ncbi:MAG: hypothetical protein AB7T17_08095 [Geobacter sp.]